MMRFVPWLLLLLVLATAGAVTLAITSAPVPEGVDGVIVQVLEEEEKRLFERLDLEPPHTGDLIGLSTLVALNRIVDRLEALEASR